MTLSARLAGGFLGYDFEDQVVGVYFAGHFETDLIASFALGDGLVVHLQRFYGLGEVVVRAFDVDGVADF
jgi:hypothetical protein